MHVSILYTLFKKVKNMKAKAIFPLPILFLTLFIVSAWHWFSLGLRWICCSHFRCKPLPLESYLRPKETEIAGSRPARVVQRGSGQKWKQGLEVASSALGKVPQLCFAICSLTFVFLVDPLEPKTPSPKMTCSIESVLQTFQAAVQKSMKFLRGAGFVVLDRQGACHFGSGCDRARPARL